MSALETRILMIATRLLMFVIALLFVVSFVFVAIKFSRSLPCPKCGVDMRSWSQETTEIHGLRHAMEKP